MLFCNLHCLPRFFQIGARDHHFGASDVDGPLEDVFEVVIVRLLAVVDPSVDGVAEVDADLGWTVSWRIWGDVGLGEGR